MNEKFGIPPISMAEVFINGRCVGFLSDVHLDANEDGGFTLEGDWSGYPDVLTNDGTFTISIPAHDYMFLADQVETGQVTSSGRVSFKSVSFLPDSPQFWFEVQGEA